jgi:hypothetical protein
MVRGIRPGAAAADEALLGVEIRDSRPLLGVLWRGRKKYGKNTFELIARASRGGAKSE